MTRRHGHFKINGEPKRSLTKTQAEWTRDAIAGQALCLPEQVSIFKCDWKGCKGWHVGRSYKTDRNESHRRRRHGAWS